MGVLTSTTNEVFRRIEMNEINGRTRRRTLDPRLHSSARQRPAGYGYYADDEIVAVLRRAPPPPFGACAETPWKSS